MASVKVGDRFVLKCGVEVTVVAYKNNHTITVKDSEGNSKIVYRQGLFSGSIKWPWAKQDIFIHRIAPIGAEFILKCGVRVKVVEHISNVRVAIEDRDGNRKEVRVYQLSTGSVRWSINGISSRRIKQWNKKYPVGSVHMSKKYGKFKIVSHNFDKCALTIMWLSSGNTQENVWPSSVVNKTVRDTTIQSDKLSPDRYYVYIAIFGSRVMYIGSGKGFRYAHVNSGISHNVSLNMHHFTNKIKLDIVIYKESLSRSEALKLEKELTLEIEPEYNKKAG